MDVDQNLHNKDDVDMVPIPSIEAADGSQAKGITPETMPQVGQKASNLPSIQEQIKTIETLLKASAENPVSEGQSAFLVSRTWLNRAQAFGSDSKQATKQAGEGHPGPVDNSDIIFSTFKDANGVDFAKLKPGLGAEHFELFSKDAWDLVLEWYGLLPGQIPVERIAHNTNPDPDGLPNVQYEFYPPVFAIHRVWSAVSPIPIDQELKSRKPPPPIVVHGTSYGCMEFLRKAKLLTDIPLATKVQLWRIPMKLPAAADALPKLAVFSTPPDPSDEHTSSIETMTGIRSWPHLLVESDAFLKLEKGLDRELLEINDQTNNPKYNGRMSLGLAGLGADQAVVIEEFVDSTIPVTKYVPKAGGRDKLLGQNSSSSNLVAQTRSNNASGRSSPAPSGPLTRGRAQKRSGRAIGTVGLSNLGNTCYMNSALQCVRSVEELTKYFISGEAEREVNVDNPLGYKGEVARAYGDLLSHLYADPPPTSYTPRMFKQTIGRFVPAFSGYGQQDSQEFVGFLLDSLQEDLSRIKKKPYIEKPDSTDEMIGDPVAIKQLADKVWDITKKRDDSVIADLFTGLYQSTLVCPVCEKISITFDPFTNLTLPLPIANVWTKIVKFYPLNDAPVNITVDIDKNSSVLSLKQFISARVGVPSERLIAGEEYNDKFFKFYDNLSVASEEIGLHDMPVVFEVEAVPTNAAAPKKGGKQKIRSLLAPVENTGDGLAWNSPMADHLAVPVIHRVNPEDNAGRSRRVERGRVPPPHFIMLTQDEVRWFRCASHLAESCD
jgi:ubiquitin carboxyl-terminal hydrolase 4/11